MGNEVTKYSEQSILNQSFDDSVAPGILQMGTRHWDGSGWTRTPGAFAKKITVDGTTTYIASAPAGTAQATAGWQVKKISVSGSDTLIQWAGGSDSFTNVATNLASLSYS